MKKNDDNKKLKQLSDQHEVPFNPAAWDRMEALLDNTTPPEPPRPRSSFFNYKNIIAMLILLMMLIYFVVPTEVDSDALAHAEAVPKKQDIYISEKSDTTKQQTKQITNENLNSTLGGRLTTDGRAIDPNDPSPQIISKQQQVQPIGGQWDSRRFDYTPKVIKVPDSVRSIQGNQSNIFKETIPSDNFFIEKIQEQLATYHEFRSEEKVYLHFNRTMLKPGESLWFSAYVRDANTLQPSKKSDIVYVEFIAPNGGILKQLKLVTDNGVAKGDIQTTAEMVGGIYKIKAYTNWQKNFKTTFERNITLQKTILPHLRMELDFQKEAYGAGDEVVAKLDLNTLENTALANFDFAYTVSLAGGTIFTKSAKTDDNGQGELKFNLPKDLDTNDGLVNVMLQYNGQGESISRSVPIVLGKMDVQFFPEGGDMIAGLENKIAFKAINEFGKPADVEGIILNSNGVIVSEFQSYHQGMGAFDFMPLPNENYTAKITKPTNIKGEFPLPVSLEKGNLMHVVKVDDDKMQVRVQSVDSQSLTLVLQSQGNVVHSTTTTPQAGEHLIEIPTKKFPIGIAQLTMFDEQERPHAERLVFLNKNKTLDISIRTDKEQYLPREKVKMQIDVKDEDGNPVQGQFSVGVTDDKLLTFADDRQGRMLAYMLLESDLKGEIEKPNFYFEPKEKHPDKDQALALDYLMMTNGWRRYTWKYERNPIAGMIFPNEKAIISGTVVNGFGEVVKDAIVKIEGLDKSVLTDENGRFIFENISLVDQRLGQNYLTITASKGDASKIFVNNYGEHFTMKIKNAADQKIAVQPIPSNGKSQIKGQVLSADGEPMIGANVYLEGTKIGGATDFDGNYVIDNVPEGKFALRSEYLGYVSVSETVLIKPNESLLANVTLAEDNNMMLNEVVVSSTKNKRRRKKSLASQPKATQPTSPRVTVLDYREPRVNLINPMLIEFDEVTEEEEEVPTKNINALAAAQGVNPTPVPTDGLIVQGSRTDATDYYIDGVRISGGLIPESELASMQMITSGTPAAFGTADDFAMSSSTIRDSENSELNPFRGNKFGREAQAGGKVRPELSKKKRIIVKDNKTIFVPSDEPMIIVDGNVLDKLAFAKIKPKDIKSVEVHEGDDLAVQYGQRGENGVIFINTKKRRGTSSNKELLEYQNKVLEKINTHVAAHEQRYDWAKKLISTQSLNLNQTRDLRIILNTSLSKIQSLQTVVSDLGRLTGNYPRIDYANRDFQFIEDFEYAYNFKNGYYAARDFYVPKYISKTKKETRDDFRPTVFWNPKVETNKNGSALLEFYNSDDLTTFKVSVEGLTPSGKIGAATHTYFTQIPFGMRTKFPNQVLVGDILNIPVTISNHTDSKMDVKLDAIVPKGFEYVGEKLSLYTIDNQEVKTLYLPFKINSQAGNYFLQIKVSANEEEDSFSKNIQVQSKGFPVNMMYSGSDIEENFQIEIKDAIATSTQVTFTVYPTVMSDLSKGMERMVRQPTGCFEQTSSKNYPNLLVLGYLNQTNNLDQDLGKKLYDVLEKGYNRLLTFEVQGGGFDWYGKPPAHEGLTAYGLMQFKDMQRVHRVDQDVIDRTANWLLTRKDGKGGWQNSKQGLHAWSAGTDAGNAYITWAMTEAGYGGKVRPEIEMTYQIAKTTQDAYVMALAVNALHNIQDGRANKLLQDLLKLQREDGSWMGRISMTRSGGKSLQIETTALAALAIMKVEKGIKALEKGMKFIAKSKTDYGFGSTQSTVLAMKALIEHAKFSKKMQTNGVVTLMVDGKPAGQKSYTAGQNTVIVFDDINGLFTEGKHDVKVLFEGTQVALPYDLAINYNTTFPKSDAECKVNLKTELQKADGKIGENIRLTIHLQNQTSEHLPNTIAKIGIPSGLNLQPWQLKELQEKLAFDYYEIMDESLVLHYRGMQPSETKTVHLDLKADLAGTYEAPASVAYLYYTNEFRSWSKPERVHIVK